VDKAFGWIGEIFQTLLKVLPWLVIVPATHGGVAFVRGYRVKEWKPGLHWYWPLVTSYKLIATVRQTQMIKSKTVMTKDLQTVIVGALVTYVVDDIVAALSKIADQFGTTAEAIAQANAIADPTQLEVGQVLIIPQAGAPPPVLGATAQPPATPGAAGEGTYTVQAGDNASAIAERFGITIDELVAANNTTIDDLRELEVGDRLPQHALDREG